MLFRLSFDYCIAWAHFNDVDEGEKQLPCERRLTPVSIIESTFSRSGGFEVEVGGEGKYNYI